MNTTATFSDYSFAFEADQDQFAFELFSGIKDQGLKVDLSHYPNGRHHLKYGGWPGVAAAMALAMRGLEPLALGAVLVPIPLSRKRLRTRGYNQAAVLATALGGATGLVVDVDLMQRARDTPTQTALTPEARAANVKDAFMAPALVEGTFVLVDDVCTTGATLASAATALVGAGAARVEAVTFARAPLPVEFSV